jgi:hypothetical protein
MEPVDYRTVAGQANVAGRERIVDGAVCLHQR